MQRKISMMESQGTDLAGVRNAPGAGATNLFAEDSEVYAA